MYIKPKFGPDAGKLQFVRADVARQLIADGRAVDPSAPAVEVLSEVVVPASRAEVRVPAAVAHRRRSRR